MLQSLRTFLESPDLTDDPFVRLESIAFAGHGAVLVLRVTDLAETETWRRWRIDVTGLREHEIRDASGSLDFHERDHVLARQLTDTRQKLAFRGAPQSVAATVGALLLTHLDVTKGWIPFDRFLNECCEMRDLLAGGYGVIADGPSFLVEEYAETLEGQGIQTSLLEEHPNRWWDGVKWQDVNASLATFILGDAYFVAEGFEEQELPSDGG